MSKKRTSQTSIWKGLNRDMKGATKEYKDRVKKTVDSKTYDQILGLASLVIRSLPKGKLGTVAVGLQLASLAFTEGAGNAWKLVDELRSGPISDDEAEEIKSDLSD